MNKLEKQKITGPHINYLKEKYQEQSTHPDGYAVPADSYSDIEGALSAFMHKANISMKSDKNTQTMEESE